MERSGYTGSMIRAAVTFLFVFVACSAENEGGTSTNLTGGSGGTVSGTGGFPSGGGGGSDAATFPVDADTPEAEASASGGSGACKSTCLGNECGSQMPNLCGGSIDCGSCGDGTDYCVGLAPVHQGAVKKAIEDTKLSNPEYFDATDTSGDGWQVLDLAGYTQSLVDLLLATGRVAQVDPNDQSEIRVRAASESTAENYHVHTSGGYTAYKYTSTCSPAGF